MSTLCMLASLVVFPSFPEISKKSQQKNVVRKVTSTNHDGMICFCCRRLVKKLPSGRAFVCMDTKFLPQVLQQIFTSAVLSSRWHPVDISHVPWTRLFFHVVIWRVLNNNDLGFKNEKKRDCLCIYLPFSFVVVFVSNVAIKSAKLTSNWKNSCRIGKTRIELARLISNPQNSIRSSQGLLTIIVAPFILIPKQNKSREIFGSALSSRLQQTRDPMSHLCYPRTAMDSTKIMETNSFSGQRHTVREKICIWKDFALSALISCSF